jgi:branched-chain amino acid transport system permease protein/urea transport system permease protein
MHQMGGETLTLILNIGYIVSTLSFVALGLVIIFGRLGVMNMAHGEFLTIGAYAMVAVQAAGWPLIWGIPLSILVTSLVGLALQAAIVRPLADRPLDTLLATWGGSILLRELVEAIFGRQYQSISSDWVRTIDLFGTPYPAYRLMLMAVVLVLMAGLIVIYKTTSVGARLQAAVSNPVLAAAAGINVARQTQMAFVIGAASTGLAGALLAPLVRIEPFMGMDYLLNSFFVMVVGGLGSLIGLVAGSAVIGGTQTIVSTFFDQTMGYSAVLVLSILFLWRRPNGLFPYR